MESLRDPAKYDFQLDQIYFGWNRVTELRPAMTAHACDEKSACPVAQNMEKMLEDLDLKLENTVTTELQKTTLADLIGDYIR